MWLEFEPHGIQFCSQNSPYDKVRTQFLWVLWRHWPMVITGQFFVLFRAHRADDVWLNMHSCPVTLIWWHDADMRKCGTNCEGQKIGSDGADIWRQKSDAYPALPVCRGWRVVFSKPNSITIIGRRSVRNRGYGLLVFIYCSESNKTILIGNHD